MLRRLIKKIIPSKGDIFFTLFIDATNTAYESAKIFVEVLKAKDSVVLDSLYLNAKSRKLQANDINKKVLQALSYMFITPIDRGDIQELAAILNKLTKRIVKIITKLNIYSIDANSDDCLIKSANTLLTICKNLLDCIITLRNSDIKKLNILGETINEIEENGIEDFRHASNEIYSGKFDTLTILKLKEVYKSIEGAIDLSINATDLIMQISLESI